MIKKDEHINNVSYKLEYTDPSCAVDSYSIKACQVTSQSERKGHKNVINTSQLTNSTVCISAANSLIHKVIGICL